jgi:membrane protease YdiL (CAAX protease family)
MLIGLMFLFGIMFNVIDAPLYQAFFGRVFYAIAILIALVISAKFIERLPLKNFGLFNNKFWTTDLLFGIFLGAFLMSLIFLIFYSFNWVEITGYRITSREGIDFTFSFFGELIKFTGVSVSEELQTRSYLLVVIAQGFAFKSIGSKKAIVISLLFTSVLFGLMHLGNDNTSLASTLNIALAGILLGIGMVYTGSVAIPLGIHLTWNFFQDVIFGMPTSGSVPETTLIQTRLTGPELFTGGAFGPEGGLIATFIMIAGCGIIVYWIKYRYGYLSIQTSLAEFPKESNPDF